MSLNEYPFCDGCSERIRNLVKNSSDMRTLNNLQVFFPENRLNKCICFNIFSRLDILTNNIKDLIKQLNQREIFNCKLAVVLPDILNLFEIACLFSIDESFTIIDESDVNYRNNRLKNVFRNQLFERLFNWPQLSYSSTSPITVEVQILFDDNIKIPSEILSSLKCKNKRRESSVYLSPLTMLGRFKANKPLMDKVVSFYHSLKSDDLKVKSINIHYDRLIIGGRYNKYQRNISQSNWFYAKSSEIIPSIENIIIDVLKEHISAKNFKFMASGREDIDVLMLGNGRPFAIDIFHAKLNPPLIDCSNIEQSINKVNSNVKISQLSFIDINQLNALKESDKSKHKHYRARFKVKSEIKEDIIENLNKTNSLIINQKTPIRVLHRRPNISRSRTIHKLTIEKTTNHLLYDLYLITDAGTYVKEFIHSDFGRTTPSLSDLIDQHDIDFVELDVENILFEWP